MNVKGYDLWAGVLLLVGGLVHLIPGLYSGLTRLTGGFPVIQIIVGLGSVILALIIFAGDDEEAATSDSKDSD